jgi:uncharacterized protein YlxP (DUF503 family)
MSPVIGVLTVTLHLPDSGSLKSKRQVVSGLLRRLRSRFLVSATEVGERDLWQIAHLVIAIVSADSRHADEVLGKALAFIEAEAGDAVITDVATELLRL